jgi:hypothetical protein
VTHLQFIANLAMATVVAEIGGKHLPMQVVAEIFIAGR